MSEDYSRYTLFPIRNLELWKYYKDQEHALWTFEELNSFAEDVFEFENKLTPDERHFLSHVLAFFAQTDAIVGENIAVNFVKEVPIPEARAFFYAQMFIETVHAETYGQMIEIYVKDKAEQARLFNAISTMPTIAKKAHWALKWMDPNTPLIQRLFAFALVEGVFFSGSFCSIFWFRKRSLLPRLCTANDLISKDEGLHWYFAAELYSEITFGKYPSLAVDKNFLEQMPKLMVDMTKEAVEIEREFVTDALPVSLIGMNPKLMGEYIEYTADRVLAKFGISPIYNTPNPFDWMVLIDLKPKTNFFEQDNTEYQKISSGKIEELAEF